MDIQGLKDKILQLAIQGKLVEQDPNDEPASALLERIKEEKDKLVKEGKIKKQKPLPEITEEEKPFDVPERWEWVRLGEVCKLITDGTHKTPKYVDKGVPFLSVKNISQGRLDKTDIKYITREEHEEISKRGKPELGDILFCRIGTLGRALLLKEEYEFSIFVSLGLLKFVENSIGDYTELMMSSPEFYRQIEDVKVGGSHTNKINLRDVPNFLIPLPPLAEQKRIVEKVDQLFALVDELDSNKEDLLEVINLTRNQVLQEAIQGKLVEQNPEDEPVSVLIQRIKKERDKLVKEGKIKKPKKLPPIEEEEKPFDIPEGWEWVRLGEVCYNLGQKKPNKMFTYIDVSSIDNKTGKVVDKLNILTPEEAPSRARKLVSVGTIIYSTVRPYLLNIAIIDGYFEFEPIVSTAFAVMNTFSGVNNKYLFYYLRSNSFTNYVDSQMVGMAYPAINDSNLFKGLFPLPPIEEQKRIVEKVDIIMNMLDELENELTTKHSFLNDIDE